MKDGGVETQSLVSVPNVPALNSKYDVKAYSDSLIVIRLWDRDIKSGYPLGAFENNRLRPAPGFSFTLPHLKFILCSTRQHLYTNSHPSKICNF